MLFLNRLHLLASPRIFLSLLLPLAPLVFAVPLTGWAQGRAEALLQFEGVQARYQASYAPGAVARGAKELLEPDDQAIAGKALKALDTAAGRAFNVKASVAAIQQEVASAGNGGAAPSPELRAAVARFAKLRADYNAMSEAGRAEFFNRERARPADAARTELLERMSVADVREVDFSSQLLMSAVVKQLARGNGGQLSGLPDSTLDMALDTLWSRGVTSTRPRNLLIVAREFEKQVTQALIAATPDADVAALLAWRNDPQAAAEREALVGTYRAEVKGSGGVALRTLVRSWPRS
ncbi:MULTISPECIES: hypothetical protein [unclassified Variovorax]|uniref:hypothetical protein n=1 Tax=unclassified Variovorax TaxID=663243 RepID=UPI0008D0118E|nr:MULTISPECIES: hypothetical protein [unclassified Variovorax]SEK15957.1 hypothetical protein SAMN05518853_12047 [Variovorax sp. OK202]SFE25985.1 hypothetical protein SAMN05444746_12047 [Variovorax sp. OK212]